MNGTQRTGCKVNTDLSRQVSWHQFPSGCVWPLILESGLQGDSHS